MKRPFATSLALTLVFIFAGCESLWEPSDAEAVHLVENYYLFFHGGKQVKADVIAREKFSRECRCFPIKFRIVVSGQKGFEKTFYFSKNKTGQVEVNHTELGRWK